MLILPYFQNKALKNRLEINRKENIEGVFSFFPFRNKKTKTNLIPANRINLLDETCVTRARTNDPIYLKISIKKVWRWLILDADNLVTTQA